jgi:hypothetical protein
MKPIKLICILFLVRGLRDCTNPIDHIYIFFRIFGIGSINGILCLHEYENCGPIVLWNPTTQAIKLISPSSLESVELSIAGVAKEFVIDNGFTSLHGFGYDNVMNDYRLISHVCFDIQGDL